LEKRVEAQVRDFQGRVGWGGGGGRDPKKGRIDLTRG